MGTIVLLIALVVEIAFAAYCTITKSNQEKVRSYIQIGSLAAFVLFALISVIRWSFRWYMLAFAVLRSFLFLSLLVLFVSFGLRYWNHANKLDQQLAETPYNIYLIHFIIVVALQMALLEWVTGPVLIKIGIVFLATLALSFVISRWILARHARAFAMVILGLFVFCLFFRP